MTNKLSVIIPVYNTEKYISKCLDSILDQTFSDFEIIIINDASTDDSQKIIDSYKKRDQRIISIVNSNNIGPGQTRNLGLKSATGKYITFVDSDDWIEKEMYKEMVNLIERSGADIVECNACVPNDNNRIYIKNLISNFNETESVLSKYITHLYKNELGIMVWNKIYKTEIIKKNHIKFIEDKKIFDEDLLFNIEIIRYSNLLITINKPFYNYFTRIGSITKTIDTFEFETSISIITKFIEMNKSFPDFEKSLHSFSLLMFPNILYPTLNIIKKQRDSLTDMIFLFKKIRNNKSTFIILKESLQNKETPFKERLFCLFIFLKMYLFLAILNIFYEKGKIIIKKICQR